MVLLFGVQMLWQWIKWFVYTCVRCVVKAFLRRTTRLCELQRICYADNMGAERTLAVEHSMAMSRSPVLRKIDAELSSLADKELLTEKWRTFEKAIEATCVDKHINFDIHRDFVAAYRVCLVQIYGYKQLVANVLKARAIAYDASDATHQTMLVTLWKQLTDKPLTGLVSKQWSDIGFQGDDPSTDFRGMGLLGLENLLYFSVNYRDSARHILMHSSHPTHGYPFAIVGINLTHVAVCLLKSGQLKTHFYNSHRRIFNREDFHKVFCYLFVSFDKLWLKSKPESVMEFNHIRDQFEAELVQQLSNYKTKFKWDPIVETL